VSSARQELHWTRGLWRRSWYFHECRLERSDVTFRRCLGVGEELACYSLRTTDRGLERVQCLKAAEADRC
jgi:hypothetical protein